MVAIQKKPLDRLGCATERFFCIIKLNFLFYLHGFISIDLSMNIELLKYLINRDIIVNNNNRNIHKQRTVIIDFEDTTFKLYPWIRHDVLDTNNFSNFWQIYKDYIELESLIVILQTLLLVYFYTLSWWKLKIKKKWQHPWKLKTKHNSNLPQVYEDKTRRLPEEERCHSHFGK